jgi:hypothetical protein
MVSPAGGDALFAAIDWQRPWLAPFRPIASRILQASEWRAALNAEAATIGLRNHRGLPIRFVLQQCLPPDVPYERFISDTGCVPTRENLHDFFNALVWLTYPKIKTRLNALQASELEKLSRPVVGERAKSATDRGRLRDAATIFDENAALMMTSDASLTDALRAHNWHEVFIRRRHAFGQQCELQLFGHALIEKLVSPYKAITAHVWLVPVGAMFFEMPEQGRRAWIDDAIASQLTGGLTMADFTPLPVLGVPGWWSCQDEAFYADAVVFRPKRT